MNIYKVVCVCCRQDIENDHEKRVEFEIEAADEQQAQELGLSRVRGILQERNRHVEIDDVQWKHGKCAVTLKREISESEMMRRLGAPTLFETQ